MSTAEETQRAIEESRKKFSEMYSNVKLGGKGIQMKLLIKLKLKVLKKERNLCNINPQQFKIKK